MHHNRLQIVITTLSSCACIAMVAATAEQAAFATTMTAPTVRVMAWQNGRILTVEPTISETSNVTVRATGFARYERVRVRLLSQPAFELIISADQYGNVRYRLRPQAGDRSDVLTLDGLSPTPTISAHDEGNMGAFVPHYAVFPFSVER